MQSTQRRPRTPSPAALTLAAPAAPPLAKLELLVDRARDFAAASKSPRTRAAYGQQWAAFEGWCGAHGLRALPALPATVACFLTERAESGIKPSSLKVAIAAIVAQHRAAGVQTSDLPSRHPQVQAVWQGIRRVLGVAPRRATAVQVVDLRLMSEALPDSLIGTRDRALLLIGFAGAFRRSEIAALDVGDVKVTRAGLVIHIRRSKADQEAAGAEVGLPYGSVESTCPVRALRTWLAESDLREGALFPSINRHGRLGLRISGRDVSRVVKRAAGAAGLDAAAYSGHSLRAGLATAAAVAGKTDRAIMAQGRWASRQMVDIYVRSAKLLDSTNAAAGIL